MADNFGFTNTGSQSGTQQEVSVSSATDVDITSDATRDLGKVILSEYTPVGDRLPVFGPLTDVELRTSPVTILQDRPDTGNVDQVASSATNVTLMAANADRLGLTIHNSSTQILYVKFGATASATSYSVKIAADGFYELKHPVYTGIVDGIWVSADGNAYVTELT